MTLSMSTPEDQVTDALARIRTLGVPFCAVHVAMSKLKPDNRGYRQLEIVSHLFEPLLNHASARLFLLSNKDFLLLTANPVMSVIEDILLQIQSLFADDPFILTGGKNDFFQTFLLQQEQDKLETLLAQKPNLPIATSHPKIEDHSTHIQEPIFQKLNKLVEAIKQIPDMLPFLRRSTVIGFNTDATNYEAFQQFYISLDVLQSKITSYRDIANDQKLMCFLSQVLDERLMDIIPTVHLTHYPKAIGVALNVESVLSDLFDKMIQSLSNRIIAQFHTADILAHLSLYHRVCQKLRDKRIAWIVCDMQVGSINLLDWSLFGAPYIRVAWSPLWKDQEKTVLLRQFIRQHPETHLIFANCDCKEALLFGCKVGIRLFEGNFIDTLCAVMAKHTCTFGQECTVDDCKIRRSVLDGDFRRKCVHEPHLDIYTPFKEGPKSD